MAFWLKRPGQSSDEAEPVGELGDGEYPGSMWADVDEWALALPHSCDAWVIGMGSREDVLAEARAFRAGLDGAIRQLEAAGEEPVSDFDAAGYLAARAGVARSLREIEAEAAELGLGPLAGLAGWQADQFERWTPFTAMLDSEFRRPYTPPGPIGGCYEASFGWVHVRPGCRCPR